MRRRCTRPTRAISALRCRWRHCSGSRRQCLSNCGVSRTGRARLVGDDRSEPADQGDDRPARSRPGGDLSRERTGGRGSDDRCWPNRAAAKPSVQPATSMRASSAALRTQTPTMSFRSTPRRPIAWMYITVLHHAGQARTHRSHQHWLLRAALNRAHNTRRSAICRP